MKAPKNLSAFWIILSFIVWATIFFNFLSSKLILSEDAVSYYDHTKFFIQNLAKGIYPLWDPYWSQGAPNDFFLRRIGAFNPFYFIIPLFESIKIPYTLAYLWFLALYYWGGMIAFYLLARRIFNNPLIAYAGYLMLMFSSLGTRLFDSYMMLVTVPILWFFYFLVAFTQTPRKHLFLGMCLSFMILASTYIPFYFFCFFAFFLISFALFYFKQIPQIGGSYRNFFTKNKLLVVLSFVILISSFIPAITFFHNSNKGQIVMPARHGSVKVVGETLRVPSSTLDFGAVEDLLYSSYFSDFRMIRFAVVYIPFFAFIVFILGLFGRMSYRAVFLFVTGFLFFICIIPRGLPFYDFLYHHIFFLKYFRNLHFFLWFVLIPLFILLILEHWKIFSETKLNSVITRKRLFYYVLIIHGAALLYVIFRSDAIVSTYGMLILSVVFWSLLVLNRLGQGMGAYALLTLALVVQPMQVYHYLTQRGQSYSQNIYSYDFPFTKLTLKKSEPPQERKKASPKGGILYYSSGVYNTLYQNVTNYSIAKYLQYNFILVDQLQLLDRSQVDFSVIEHYFLNNDNRAFIFKGDGANPRLTSSNPKPSLKAQRIPEENEDFKIMTFNANYLKIAIKIPYDQFLIYNDSYDPAWRVKVNGAPVHLYQTNIAFKGVWLPAGQSVVEFHYGHAGQYAMNIILLMGAFAFLGGIVWFRKKG